MGASDVSSASEMRMDEGWSAQACPAPAVSALGRQGAGPR